MFSRHMWRRLTVVPLALVAVLILSTAAAAQRATFFEETAEAFWAVPYECADGSIAEGTLLVKPTRDFESPDTEDSEPTVRVQFLAVCPDGASFSWGAPAVPATITSVRPLRRITAVGSGTATDIFGVAHAVTFDVTWTGRGRLETTINAPGSVTKVRAATAVGTVTFDGTVIADGPADHPTRPAPFIRVDIER